MKGLLYTAYQPSTKQNKTKTPNQTRKQKQNKKQASKTKTQNRQKTSKQKQNPKQTMTTTKVGSVFLKKSTSLLLAYKP